MKAYSYDKYGVFNGSVNCHWDKITETWLTPINTTEKIPPEFVPNKVAVFDGYEWELVTDNRGTYYDIQTKEKITIYNPFQSIINLTKIEPPKESYFGWNGTAWEADLEIAKLQKIIEIKTLSNSIIIARYPEWKQMNLSADREFAMGYIAAYKHKLKEEINNEIVDKLISLTPDALIAIRNNFSLLNITNLISGMPENVKLIIEKYYKWIALSFIAYVLITNIREWSNQKELEINNSNSIEELKNIILDDYLVI